MEPGHQPARSPNTRTMPSGQDAIELLHLRSQGHRQYVAPRLRARFRARLLAPGTRALLCGRRWDRRRRDQRHRFGVLGGRLWRSDVHMEK